MTLIAIFLIVFLLIVIISGMYIGPGLALIGIVGFEIFAPRAAGMIGNSMFNSIANFTLAAIPLFMFMGEIVLNTNISKKLYNGLSDLLSPMPGVLLHSNIFSCALFGAISGSSIATAAAIGSVAYPEQKSRHYPVSLISGSLAAGGTLGILIPPSITLIIYGSMTGVSIGRLFMGGFLPGILLSLIFGAYILFYSIKNRDIMPRQEKFLFKDYVSKFLPAVKNIFPVLIIGITIIVGIYGGILTATEAAALTVVEALIIALIQKSLSLKIIKKSAMKALVSTSMMLFVLMGSKIFGNIISMLKLPAQLARIVANAGLTPMTILLCVTLLYLFLGCIMSAVAMIVLTLPITYPLMVGVAGFNPIWFGIYIVIINQIALITPPVGMNVYIIYGISGEEDLLPFFKSIVPFLLCMIVFSIIIILFPQIVLYLPSLM